MPSAISVSIQFLARFELPVVKLGFQKGPVSTVPEVPQIGGGFQGCEKTPS
jgi:hypothetical protein